MLKTKGKNLAILLAMIMVVCMMPMTAFAEDLGDIQVSIPNGENIVLSAPVVSGTTITYTVNSLVSGYYPFNFSLQLSPASNVSTTNIVGTNGSTAGKVQKHQGDYYLVTLPEGTASTVTIISNNNDYTYVLNCQAPNGGSSAGSSNVYAALCAPGQFTNEGMGSGGWGDMYASNGVLKNNSSTGLSLGFFGGYEVYDFGQILRDANGNLQSGTGGIINKDTNPYGADFIAFGNAFWNNSEPGCIQVSQDGNTWYDIAGSLHYDNATVWDYSLTYTNPTIADDVQGAATSTKASVPYTGSATGTVTANNYHNHSYFPLNRNYFSPRTINNVVCPTINKTSLLPFATYTAGNANTAATLTLTGTMLGGITSSGNTNTIPFGYCDVHPNKSLGGTVAYNPYADLTSQSNYNTSANGTSGGDPIDISWAVNSNGEPVALDCIRFVRVYTGTAAMNGPFGEISTEVTGVTACTGTGSSTVEAPTDIKVGADEQNLVSQTTTNGGTTSVELSRADTAYVVVDATAENIYINGTRVTSGSVKEIPLNDSTKYVRVITQSGNGQPYLTLFEITN